MRLFMFALVLLYSTWCLAETSSQGSQQFGNYEIHYSILPSSFIQPEVAAAAGVKRSKYESLINISVTRHGEYGGLPTQLSGTVTNLMQQQKVLQFNEINEQSVVYYLAPVRVASEEVVHFEVVAQLADSEPFTLKFSTKLYPDK